MTGPAGEHDVLADARVRELLARYVALAGATLVEVSPHLFELTVPPRDRPRFGRRARLRLAFSVGALEDDPDAEMAIAGSAFVEQLVDAVRSRGTRQVIGTIEPGTLDVSASPVLPPRVRRGRVESASARFAIHGVGRLTARVVIRAGTSLEEHLVTSGAFDLATGVALGADVAAACEAWQPGTGIAPASGGVPRAPTRPAGELVTRMLGDLEARLRPELDRLRERAQHELAHELQRIERYYAAMLADAGGRAADLPANEARRAIEAEQHRRADEERERHDVRATVHPVQLSEWDVYVERAEWALADSAAHRATFVAQRTLAGERRWLIACGSCGRHDVPELVICHAGHVACDACAHDCSVCSSGFCAEHGLDACHVDGAPACATHARTCRSCWRRHCSAHEGECADDGHRACTTCLAPCAHCGRMICDWHATSSSPVAPKGARRLCAQCVRHCEGGIGEVVGPDEVTSCASCERVVCETHQARCGVDGLVHCSSHLRRVDRSRRLVCQQHRAKCAYEPNAVFAADEVFTCATCGAVGCATHLESCVEDDARHCITHLAPVRDRPGRFACEAHRSTCHVDGATFSRAGTGECPVCRKQACAAHRFACASCGRSVCTADRSRGDAASCTTCGRLAPESDPSDRLIAAAVALGVEVGRVKGWRVASDASDEVVELDLGWTRRLVFAVPHGEQRAESAVSHSLLGASRIR